MTQTTNATFGLAWSEDLKPLGDPFKHSPHGTSDPTRYTPSRDEIVGFQIRLLAQQCDALLRRCEEHEQLLLSLLTKGNQP